MRKLRVVKYGLFFGLLPILMGAEGGCNIADIIQQMLNGGGGTTVPVTVAVGNPSATAVKAGASVTYTVTYTGATTVTLAAADVTLNKTGTANGTVAVSGTGTATRTVTVSGVSGDGTLGITLAANTASNEKAQAPASAASATFTVDSLAPLASISGPSVPAVLGGGADTVTYTVTYTGASTITLADADVTVVKTGTANANAAVSGSGDTRTVTLSGITGVGTVAISVAAGTAADAVGNTAAAPAASAAVQVVSGPTISVSIPSVSATRNGPVTFTVYYAAAIVNVAAADVTLNKTGTALGNVDIAGTGMLRTVTVSNITGTGTLGITVKGTTAQDAYGNPAADATSATFTVDTTAPTVTVKPVAVPPAFALGSPVHFTATFSEPVYKPASALITVTGTAFQGNVPAVVCTAATDPSATWDIAVSNMKNAGDQGTVAVVVQAAAAQDVAGNDNTASTNVDNVINWDLTPAATIVGAGNKDLVKNAGSLADPIVFTLTFNKALPVAVDANALKAALTITGTAGADTIAIGAWNQTVATVNVYKNNASAVDGTAILSLTAGALKDAQNNANTAATGTVTRDTVAPTVTIALANGQASYMKALNTTLKYTVTFSKTIDISTFAAGDLTLTTSGGLTGNTTVTALTGGPQVWNVELTVANQPQDGDVAVSMAATKVKDTVGNDNVASTPVPAPKVTVYQNALAVVGVELVPGVAGNTTLDVTFNHDMDQTSVQTAGSYTFPFNPGFTVTTATQQSNLKVVRLVCSGDVTGKTLQVATALTDKAGNALAAAAQIAGALPFYDNAKFAFAVVSAVKQVDPTKVDVTFNHQVAPATAVTLAKYVLNAGGINPTGAVVDANLKVVHLTFAADVSTLTLTVTKVGGVQDNAGGVATNLLAADWVAGAAF